MVAILANSDTDKRIPDALKIRHNGFVLYMAGLPSYGHVFGRDPLIASILGNYVQMLHDHLSYDSEQQGTKRDPFTSEEPGKIIHQNPGVIIRGNSTLFAGCDQTALYLIGFAVYERLTGDASLREKFKGNIEQAANYILSHLSEQYLFQEDPGFSDAKSFALKVTYWKDSRILDRKRGEPTYPVTYSLAHIINTSGLGAAARLLESEYLEEMHQNMEDATPLLFDQELGTLYIAIDRLGPIRGISSDALHSLFYLEPGILGAEQVENLIDASSALETKIGYRTLDEISAARMKDSYHTSTVWPQEQAFINSGARKFLILADQSLSEKLSHVIKVSSRYPFDTLHEISRVTRHKHARYLKKGCNPHLFTIAAQEYSRNPRVIEF